MSWEQRNEDFSKAQTDAQMAYIEAEREVRRLESENARLRQEIEVVGTVAYVHGVKQLKAENAKLRKMLASTISNYVDGYMDDTSARYPCDLCDESSKQRCDYQHDRQCPFYKQLRELGVEVDG